jgi:hypothetical protein
MTRVTLNSNHQIVSRDLGLGFKPTAGKKCDKDRHQAGEINAGNKPVVLVPDFPAIDCGNQQLLVTYLEIVIGLIGGPDHNFFWIPDKK